MKKQLVFNRPVWIFLLFLVGNFLFVDLNFRYWFHFMEQFMLFQTTSVYWKELAAQLGGWNEYIAEYLTQAFSFAAGPAILVTTLSGLIALLFYKYQQACCGKASMGLSMLPLFLFWLFPSETIVPMLVLVWTLVGTVVCQSISNQNIRMLVGVLLVPLLYYVAVPAPYLYAVLLLLHEWMRADQRKPYLYTGVLLAWTFLLPLLVMRLWLVVPMREVWMGKYMYLAVAARMDAGRSAQALSIYRCFAGVDFPVALAGDAALAGRSDARSLDGQIYVSSRISGAAVFLADIPFVPGADTRRSAVCEMAGTVAPGEVAGCRMHLLGRIDGGVDCAAERPDATSLSV